VLPFVSERSLGKPPHFALQSGIAESLLVERYLGVFELQHKLQDALVLRFGRRRSESIPGLQESVDKACSPEGGGRNGCARERVAS
jgi:hypothetical protein